MKTYQAFKNDPELKSAFMAQMEWHREQDKIVGGIYGAEFNNGDFRGCFVGCSIHSLAVIQGKKLTTSNHQLLEDLLDIPVELAHTGDAVFESLPATKRPDFAVDFGAAIPVGADLKMVVPQFVYWMLIEDAKPTRFPQFQAFIDAVVALYEEWTRTGVRPSESTDLAYLADRADLAYRAYRAYRAYLADRADLADRAETSAAKLLDLLAAAPVLTGGAK